jgi:hypothetical protein
MTNKTAPIRVPELMTNRIMAKTIAPVELRKPIKLHYKLPISTSFYLNWIARN